MTFGGDAKARVERMVVTKVLVQSAERVPENLRGLYLDKVKMLETVECLVVQGVTGKALYVNDYRVSGPKPWGGGKEVAKFKIDVVALMRALRDPNQEPAVELVSIEPAT